MLHYVASHRLLTIVVILALLGSLGAIAFLLFSNASKSRPYDWPPLTMVYEFPGPTFNQTTTREVHRFEYRSWRDWKDTVIESDVVQTRGVGGDLTIGGYQRVKGTRYEEYDVFDDITSVEELGENTIRVPNGFIQPKAPPHIMPTLVEGDETEIVDASTIATVCYRTECEDNAVGRSLIGRAFNMGPSPLEKILLDDPRWGILLKVGERWVVRSLEIDAEPPTARE